jgi:hypothetical protein
VIVRVRCAGPVFRVGLAAVLAFATVVHAAHPLISEDTATEGTGRFELEMGNAWTRDGSQRSYEVDPQLSCGVLPQLDAILRPSWIDQHTNVDGSMVHARGAGDTTVDLKWRFFERGKTSLAVRAGLDAPTGDAGAGLGVGKTTWHALAVASVDAAPLAVHANLGYTSNRSDPMERRDLYHASAAAVWTVNESWRVLLLELAADTAVDRAQSTPPAVARVGAIYTVTKGLDVDVGYQGRLNSAAPAAVLLVGVTVRWGP